MPERPDLEHVVPRLAEALVGVRLTGLRLIKPVVLRAGVTGEVGERLTALKKLASKRSEQVRVFVMNKALLDAFGNAYADEVLHAAGLHPKRRVRDLSDAELAQLHAALVGVTRHAIEPIAAREPALDDKVRDVLKVRNRKGQPCPTCGTKVRVAGVRGHDAFFCPSCQPDRAGTGLVDWTRLDR